MTNLSESEVELNDTPRFKKPPVVETVLGVQFRPLPITLVHLGKVFETLQSKGFGTVQYQPHLPHQLEQKNAETPIFTLPLFMHAMGQQRHMFVSSEGSDRQRFIQIQNDRLIQNWQRSNTLSGAYPSYSSNRQEFLETFESFISLAEQTGLGPILADQCEVTYVNQIPLDGFSGTAQAFSECFGISIPARPLAHVQCDAENMSFQSSHWSEQARGRLYIQAAMVIPVPMLGKQRQVIDFRITLRGAPNGATKEDVLRWLDLGHFIVTNTFADITTDSMHTRWEREK